MENRYLFLGICFVMVLISFLICFFLLKLILKISNKKKIFDYFDKRKLNKEPRPRIGGIAIFVSYFFVIYLFVFFTFLHKGNFLEDIIGILPFKIFLYSGAILCIFILGLLDDFSPLKAKYKLLVEFAVSIPICIIGFNIKFISVPFGIGHIDLGLFSLPITILWIVGVINAINLIDGLDGLGLHLCFVISTFIWWNCWVFTL
jgi:UDP-GlcNAc:undecaprenyl-phosphate GlcNAc-1-phosphate transferase